MNILKLVALALAILVSAQVFAAEPTPAEKRAAELQAEADAARTEVAREKEMAKAQAKAEWASKSFTEAWKIRGQACVDAGQYSVGQVGRGLCNADGYIGMAVAVPSAYLTAAAFSGAEASKTYAQKAWDNDVQVAVKTEAPKASETK